MSDFYHSVKNLVDFAESDVKRVGTGFTAIDNVIRGITPGEVCMIMGPSGSGKSILGQNITYLNKALPSIFFSMEMPANQAVIRLYSMWSNADQVAVQLAIEAGDPPTDMWDMIPEFKQHRIIDQSGLTVSHMSDHVLDFERDLGVRPAFVVVDYLELLGGTAASAEGVQGVDAQATMLKDWAKQEEMRVFVLHQTNQQQQEWEAPRRKSARYGGYTQADFVVGLWRPHKDPSKDFIERLRLKNTICANVLKNRAFGEDLEYAELPILPSLRIWQENNAGSEFQHTQSAERRREDAVERSTKQEGNLPDPFSSFPGSEYVNRAE